MKKAILLALCLALIGAGAAMATPYDIANTTQIQQWTTTTAGAWTAPGVSIPPNSEYTTLGANFNHSTGAFTIYTNWQQSDKGVFYGSYINTAFLFINPTGGSGWTYAIDLVNSQIYQNLSITNSEGAGGAGPGGPYTPFGNNGSIWYGRYYGTPSPLSQSLIPVLATGTNITPTGFSVNWGFDTTPGSPTYGEDMVTMNLSSLLTSSPWDFIWGTGTCGNGTFEGSLGGMVPLPPSALLLGTGLLGLVGLRRSRKS